MADKKKEDNETIVKDEKENSQTNQNFEEKYSSLEKKFGELSENFQNYKEFTDGATVVINTIAGNPDLARSFREELQKTYGSGVVQPGQESGQQQKQDPEKKETPNVPNEQIKAIDGRVSGVEASRREEIVRGFEDKYGISSLKPEEQKETRKQIEGFMNDFGSSVKTVPLTVLSNNLEKAYVATHAEKLRSEGRLEGFTQAHANNQATMPSMSSGTIETNSEGGLTSGQKLWAGKLGVDENAAAEAVKNQDKEYITPSDAEKKASGK